MKLNIRQMEEKDIEAVQEVATTSWHTTYQGIIPIEIQDAFLAGAYSKKMLIRRLKGSHFFIAVVDGKVIGFANYAPVTDKGTMELAAIYVLPAYQGGGIGSALLEAGRVISEGAEIIIHVEKENTIGRRFYERKGFKALEEFTENFSGHFLQTIRMVLYPHKVQS
ncbi:MULTISPECIES: GNAT family N-acetyltransferase [Clostridia]|uniref:GNAT family N-acetyltransferase n=1 Tax=Clostridia TaxID=186801 RepID=UPI000EA236AC|nr:MULTISPECIES: GNAT family N-acetyltransferase [Clostridia]NBJ69849.1 GNAT family N-acetyltransferase [Roseburia sp. 1XD42-34]RKI77652.1 GNAT family N-acetyltransferase [Clostridium sp. 1xD42-85]